MAGGVLTAVRSRTRTTLWIWPSVTVVVAAAAGTWLSTLEAGAATGWFLGGGTAGRTVLTALVSGLVTALSVVFSITLIGLQTVHSQYSPRLLRNFIQDAGAQVTLSTFAGASAYLLAVLRRIPQPGSPEPVPRLAILVGMLLFLICVGVVAYYAQHITHSIRVSSAMDRVVEDALRFGSPSGREDVEAPATLPEPPDDAVVVPATRTGYMQGADLDALADLARAHGVTVRVRPMVGDLVVTDGPLAWVWPRDGDGGGDGARGRARDGRSGVPDREALRDRLAAAVQVSGNRTLERDATFGLRQLVDVAIRAVSPALNDPYTAVEAVDHLTVMLCRLADRPLGAHVRRDDDGAVLAVQPGPDLLACVRLAVDQIRRYGSQEPAVAIRLLTLLREVGRRAPEDARPGLREQVRRVLDHAEDASGPADDLGPVRAAAAVALDWIDGRVTADEVAFARL